MSGTAIIPMTPTGIEVHRGSEINTDQAMMRAQQEVQGSIIVAKRFPRNEDEAAQALWRTCKRSSFADRAEYKFPRGRKKDENNRWVDNIVSGPSASLAREAMRLWGNIQAGTEIVRDTEEDRHIRSFAWDMERNSRKVAETSFRKLIQRKDKESGETRWVAPDERDLRELTNKHAAIAERNCILQLIPSDIVEEAIRICRDTLRSEASSDPDAARRRLISGFDELNVTVGMLEAYLGHALAQSSPKEIADLRAVWVSIRDGNSTWAELMSSKVEEAASVISGSQAAEFYSASKSSGYTDEDRKAFVRQHWNVEDSRKIPSEPASSFEEAMKWARTKKSAGDPVQATLIEHPSEEDTSEVRKRIDQLFEAHGTDKKTRQSMLQEFAGILPSLASKLEGMLPAE
jgi:hypothetical protein